MLLMALGVKCVAIAQDVIVMRNGSRIATHIDKITTSHIEYHQQNWQDGPLFEAALNEVQMIVFSNGKTFIVDDHDVLREVTDENSSFENATANIVLMSEKEANSVLMSRDSVDAITLERQSIVANEKSETRRGIDWAGHKFSVFAGAGIQNMIGYTKDESTMKHRPNFAWRVGMTLEIPLTFAKDAWWMAEAAFGNRGWHGKEEVSGGIFGGSFTTTYKTKYHCYNLQLTPFMFGWDFHVRDIIIRPFAGPYLSFDFAGGEVYTIDVDGQGGVGNSDQKTKTSIWDKENDGKRSHNFFDIGANFGSNVYFYDHLYAGVLLQLGWLQDMKKKYRDNTKSGSNCIFLVTFGYIF